MSFGKMNTFLSIVEKQFTQDEDGFKTEMDVTVAKVRAYREGRHGSEKWANMASFSTATDLFQMCIRDRSCTGRRSRRMWSRLRCPCSIPKPLW